MYCTCTWLQHIPTSDPCDLFGGAVKRLCESTLNRCVIFCVNFVVFATYVYLSDSFTLPQSDQTLLLVIMLACFAVAFLSVFRAAQMAGSVRVAMIMNLEPIVSIVLSVIILAEAVNLRI